MERIQLLYSFLPNVQVFVCLQCGFIRERSRQNAADCAQLLCLYFSCCWVCEWSCAPPISQVLHSYWLRYLRKQTATSLHSPFHECLSPYLSLSLLFMFLSHFTFPSILFSPLSQHSLYLIVFLIICVLPLVPLLSLICSISLCLFLSNCVTGWEE